MDKETQSLIDDVKTAIQGIKNLKDPYRDDAIYLKKVMGGCIIISAAKITEHASLEAYAGGSLETMEECPEAAMMNFQSRGFIEATKEEYDNVVKRAVREINALV